MSFDAQRPTATGSSSPSGAAAAEAPRRRPGCRTPASEVGDGDRVPADDVTVRCRSTAAAVISVSFRGVYSCAGAERDGVSTGSFTQHVRHPATAAAATDTARPSVSASSILTFQRPIISTWYIARIPYNNNNLGLRLDDEAVRVAVGMRLGLSLCVPHSCPCGEQVDAQGLHATVCKKAPGRIARHQVLNDYQRTFRIGQARR